MKKILPASAIIILIILFNSCEKVDLPDFGHHNPPGKSYDAGVAVAWIKLQQQISKTTPGFSPGVTGRAFGYSGITLYESVQPGFPGYQSLASQLAGSLTLPAINKHDKYYWPASANRAMAIITRNLFAATTPANKFSIDSLETSFNTKFQTEAPAAEITRAVDFGGQIATAIFDWSKTDGSLAVYPPYVPPAGSGLWIPTPPAFAPAAAPYQGTFRSFITGIADKAALPPPIAYSDVPGSAFYNMANEVYTLSLSLTAYDTTTVRFWADLPGQFNGPAHFTSVLSQLIEKENLHLGEAAIAYAKHGIAITDAGIACFKTKYQYNLIRPISYIRSVLSHPSWNAVIATPPHPEYSSAHAIIMQATAEVLKDIFGSHYSFTDHSFDVTYGSRHYNSFDEYAWEGAWSRVIGGIHYKPTAYAGIQQGKKVGVWVNKLKFHGND